MVAEEGHREAGRQPLLRSADVAAIVCCAQGAGEPRPPRQTGALTSAHHAVQWEGAVQQQNVAPEVRGVGPLWRLRRNISRDTVAAVVPCTATAEAPQLLVQLELR